MRSKEITAAFGDAAMIKRISEGEAASKDAIGKAEAEGMDAKAKAYKHYGEAALIAMVVENLPEIACEICKPLTKLKNILLIDGEEKVRKEEMVTADLSSINKFSEILFKNKIVKREAWCEQNISLAGME